MRYALEVEMPKAVKGLSSMLFTVRRWIEVALSDDKAALEEYAAEYPPTTKTRVVERYVESEEGK